MNFIEYQMKAQQTATYPQEHLLQALSYLGLGLTGEAGEVADKLKKWLRGDYPLDEAKKKEIAYELGDLLWYISEMARKIEYDLHTIAVMNTEKLSSRQKRGTLHGDGDNR